MAYQHDSNDNVRRFMSFPDNETILKLFGPSKKLDSQHHELAKFPAIIIAERQYTGLGQDKCYGMLIVVPSLTLDEQYRRFLWNTRPPAHKTLDRMAPILTLHDTQGASWAQRGTFEVALQECVPAAKSRESLQFVAFTDSSENVQHQQGSIWRLGDIS